MPELLTTTRTVAELWDLFGRGRLDLAPEFQRNSVWPSDAKAYLIDTILEHKPIGPILLYRHTSIDDGTVHLAVVDGQQRLRAIFDFLGNRFGLTQSNAPRRRQRFMTLSDEDKRRVLEYQVIAQELLGYSEADIRDVFIRMNKYVFQLSRQELRHARESGAFARFAAEVGAWSEWADLRVFTATTLSRMRAVEFAAELAILLIEGPQDKKSAVDLYYKQYREEFQEGARVSEQLRTYLSWITAALPDLRTTRFRKPVDLYSLIGALHELNAENRLKDISPDSAGEALRNFEAETKEEAPGIDAARYVAAASRQTDNIRPRQTRIEILERILAGA